MGAAAADLAPAPHEPASPWELRAAHLRSWWRVGLLAPPPEAGALLGEFRREEERLGRQRLPWFVALLALFNATFWFTDATVFRAVAGAGAALAPGRVALLLLAALAVGALRWTSLSAYSVGGAAGAAMGLVVGASLAGAGGPSTPWFHFLYPFMFAPLVAWLLPPRRAAVTFGLAALCLLGYFGRHLEYLRDPYAPAALAHLGYVTLLSLAVGWYVDLVRWKLFVAQTDVSQERERLASRVGEATRALRDLARHMDVMQDAERARIARELHDELGQTTTALRMVLRTARGRHERDPAAIGPNLAQLALLLEQLTQQTRGLVSDLRPRVLDDLGLDAALEWLADRTSERGTPCAMHRPARVVPLPPAVSTAAFRCAQEALTNVVKHAQATQAELHLRVEERAVVVEVRDDGVGFDPAARAPDAFGLLGMRERARALDGAVDIDSTPGRGTTLRVSLPFSAPPQGAA